MHYIYVALGLIAGGVIVAVLGYLKNKRAGLYNLYVDASQPSELAAGVPSYYGGTVVAVQGQPTLTAPYSKQPCVWYRYVIEEEVRNRDDNGVRTTNWQQVSNDPPQSVLFGLQSAGGVAFVNATSASVKGAQEYESFIDAATMNGRQDAPNTLDKVQNVFNRLDGRRMRVRESYIPLGQQLYAGGTVIEQAQSKTFTNDQSYPLVLSTQSKEDLVKSEKRTGLLEYGGAAVLVIAAIIVFTKVKG